MPTPYDLLSQRLDTPTDPNDQLRLLMGQDQGASLAGGPAPTPDGMPDTGQPLGGSPQPVAASANIPGPLAALANKPIKPKIKLKPKRPGAKPHIKLRIRPSAPPMRGKPHIKLKSGGLDGLRP
jgi:hypothetical protein